MTHTLFGGKQQARRLFFGLWPLRKLTPWLGGVEKPKGPQTGAVSRGTPPKRSKRRMGVAQNETGANCRFGSMLPLTRVPLCVPIFDPQPDVFLFQQASGSLPNGRQGSGGSRAWGLVVFGMSGCSAASYGVSCKRITCFRLKRHVLATPGSLAYPGKEANRGLGWAVVVFAPKPSM